MSVGKQKSISIGTRGFTIVELLIVIVVLAILASISIVAYRGIQNQAYDSAVQSDLRNIGQKLSMYRVQEGRWPISTTEVGSMGIKVSKEAYGNHLSSSGREYNLVYCRLPDGSGDTALVGRSKSGEMYSYNGGSVRSFTGRWTGSSSTCSDAISGGSVSWGGNDRVWLYDSDAWQSFL